MKTKSLWLVSLSFVIFFGVEVANACSCVISNPCQMNQRADAVFIGKIKDVERKSGSALHKVKIEKHYEGFEGKDEVEIYTDQSSSCAFSMAKDETYIIFARINEKTGIVTTWFCSGTKPLKTAEKEIKYLESLKNAPDNIGVLSGKILEYNAHYKNEKEPVKPKEIDKVFLESENGEIFETKINDDGSYIFAKLKGGYYKVSVNAPQRLISTDEIDTDYFAEKGFRKVSKRVKVLGSGCSSSEYYTFYVNGIISGRVLNSEGFPLAKMPVTVFRFEDVDDMPEKIEYIWTNENGVYSVKGLPPARYLLGFSIGDNLYVNSHYAGYLPMFFGNKTKRNDAQYINLGYNEILTGKDITLLPELKKRKITGQVLDENGQSAKNADATFYVKRKVAVDRTRGGYDLKLDSEGKFELDIYDQTEYWIFARVFDSQNWETRKIIFSSKCYKVTEKNASSEIKIVLQKDKNNCDVEKL